ncbi:hypothetical protein NQ314_009768 [Rhamnusium bicolor]|uniref:Uncharacterized protein n=1 Tax=Rhamnusium bicolor TaxID=1586634 RepID=A0AAV8XXF3_9CUCU|nr:hypothetical protein NQ314_009768 [Rhamnusium bicolor]
MNSFVFCALFAFFAAANAGIVAPTAGILQGPSSRTTLVGPEGSVISSVSPGGQVVSEQIPGVAAYSAPVLATSPVVYSAPAVAAYGAPGVIAANSFFFLKIFNCTG